MNYENLYLNIVSNAQSLNRTKDKKQKDIYFERHHILPKCMGGKDDICNLVLLTAKEHFICHHLLTKIYPENSSLKFAFWAMCNQTSGDILRPYKITSSTFTKAREAFAKENSKLHSNKKISDHQKEQNSIRMKGNTFHKKGIESHLFNKPRSESIKAKISETKRLFPENHPNFTGYYITPFGRFSSNRLAAKLSGVSQDTIHSRCKNSSSVVTLKHILRPVLLEEKDLGKTFKELGWDFEPVPLVSSVSQSQ